MAVVVRFSSGLGNQLCQFGAGYAVASGSNAELVADPLAFTPAFNRKKGRVSERSFELLQLGFPMRYRKMDRSILTRLRGYSRARNLLYDFGKPVFDSANGYQYEFESLGSDCVLRGHFQDIRFYKGREDRIAEIVASILRKNFGEMEEIECAIHVRRGDYLNHPEFFPDEFEHYYRNRAISLEKEFGVREIHVFSDDIGWCKSNIKIRNSTIRFVEQDSRFGGAIDLYRMSMARVLSIANSTYSWWAGLLGELQGNQVIAPSKWASWCECPKERLYPKSWDTAWLGTSSTQTS